MRALFSNTTGNNNTATGQGALFINTTGSNNTATGQGALASNNASANTANGAQALNNNTTGIQNTATGYSGLQANTSGSDNTANGFQALRSNTTGNDNTASGGSALNQLTTGSTNTAEGQGALRRLTTGSNNIAVGFNAGFNLTTENNNIDIGNTSLAGDANVIRLGKVGTQNTTFIAGISGKTVANGVGVLINPSGQLGTILSSERFKENIRPMDKASEAILALKPVTFRYKRELDRDGIPQFGLVAEEVEKVSPDLVARDAEGKVYTVRYEAVNAMLLNEFLKEHRKNEEQEKTIAELKSGMTALAATMKEQAAQIQKVSAELELSKAAPHTVLNSQ
jgi:hypothetical protein